MADTLPPLPEPDVTAYITDSAMRSLQVRAHSDRQLEAYARAALAAVPAQPLTDEQIHESLCEACSDGSGPVSLAEFRQDEAFADMVAFTRALERRIAAAPQADELAKAHEARRQAQAESAELKERMARVRLDLMRELKEQGWAAPQAVPVPEWQPIETAPRGSGKDGPQTVTHPDYVKPPELLLLHADGIAVGYYDWYYHLGYGKGASPYEPAWRSRPDDSGLNDVTHWMPLPAAPKDQP